VIAILSALRYVSPLEVRAPPAIPRSPSVSTRRLPSEAIVLRTFLVSVNSRASLLRFWRSCEEEVLVSVAEEIATPSSPMIVVSPPDAVLPPVIPTLPPAPRVKSPPDVIEEPSKF